MNNIEFVNKLKDVANKYKTLYVMGCFGAPMSDSNKKRYIDHHSYNSKPARKVMISKASADTFGFDCVCLLKGVLWGWSGNTKDIYGGAKYQSNGVPDINTDSMINACREVSTDFSDIEVGEAVWLPGHIGVYIGDGYVVECTPSWKNGVQITPLLNFGTQNGTNGHKWTKHGKLPYITYLKEKTKADEIAEYVSVLQKEGIITEPTKWKQKASADNDIYWLLRKTASKF